MRTVRYHVNKIIRNKIVRKIRHIKIYLNEKAADAENSRKAVISRLTLYKIVVNRERSGSIVAEGYARGVTDQAFRLDCSFRLRKGQRVPDKER